MSVEATDLPLNEAVYDLVRPDGSINYTETTNASSSSTVIKINGIDIRVAVSAWSDTRATHNSYDGNVELAHELSNWYGGLTVTNQDSGDSHYIDNYYYNDFDMILFSFDKAVTLSGASFNSADSTNGVNDVTVAGLSDDVLTYFNSGTSSWADIAGKAISGATGHFGISSLQSTFEGLTSAKYWLVGAYNSVFEGDNNQHNKLGFKLSSINVRLSGPSASEPPNQVSEPGALALMSLGLGLVLYRRKHRA